jgi:hypothetical protein
VSELQGIARFNFHEGKLEEFKHSEALIEHNAHLGDLREAIRATGLVSGELIGEPRAKLRATMAGSGVGLFTPYLSM